MWPYLLLRCFDGGEYSWLIFFQGWNVVVTPDRTGLVPWCGWVRSCCARSTYGMAKFVLTITMAVIIYLTFQNGKTLFQLSAQKARLHVCVLEYEGSVCVLRPKSLPSFLLQCHTMAMAIIMMILVEWLTRYHCARTICRYILVLLRAYASSSHTLLFYATIPCNGDLRWFSIRACNYVISMLIYQNMSNTVWAHEYHPHLWILTHRLIRF